MSAPSRKLNALEQKIHQAALAAEDQTVTMSDLSLLEDDATARTAALNFLLSAGLLKPMKSSSGKLHFRAIGKKEVDVKKDLSAEENLVLNHIQASGNEGIWTKHIKAKTELHQTILDRCLKSLVQKKLVKAVSGSVQHPTRKMYMLFHLEPSVEVTGGPWYTDKELDTEFIKLLSKACLKFIRDRSFPRQSTSIDSSSLSVPSERLLYPISNPPAYPSAPQVQTFLNKSRITETQLTVDHVEMLLNVLCVDGDIEKVPAMGAALWDSGAMDEGDQSGSDDDMGSRRKKKSSSSKKRKRKVASSSEEESESDAEMKKRKKKKAKRKRKDESEDDDGSEDEDMEVTSKKKKAKKGKAKRRKDESESESDEESDGSGKRKKRSKSKKRRRASSDESSGTDSSDSDAPSRKRSRSSSRQATSSSAKLKLDLDFSSTHVYRAVHPERLALSFGWNQAPCLRCPTFEFCAPIGPVNAKECVYYGDWLTRKEIEEVS